MTIFSRGSRVRLRSGSLDLCVVGVFGEATSTPTVAVAWYTAAGELKRADLPADALVSSPSMAETPEPEAEEEAQVPDDATQCLALHNATAEIVGGVE